MISPLGKTVCLRCLESERFTAEPEDALLAKGQVHLLRCSVENLVGEVQWLRDGFGLGLGTEFEGFPRYKVLRNEHLGDVTLYSV